MTGTILGATLSLGVASAYILTAILFRKTLFGVQIQVPLLIVIVGVTFVGLGVIIRWLVTRRFLTQGRLTNLTLTTLVALFCMLAADNGYTIYLNKTEPNDSNNVDQEYYRQADPQLWGGELFPRVYFPTSQDFKVHKPNVTLKGEIYGAYYFPPLMQSATLAEHVFQLKRVSMIIDQHGFRETTPLEDARIFALGDSLTFGAFVDQKDSWVERVQRLIGQPLYNLGVNGGTPVRELRLLDFLLRTKGPACKPQHVLWMFFEGNDFEEPYHTSAPIGKKNIVRRLLGGTMLDLLTKIPYSIKRTSLIRQLVDDRIRLSLPTTSTEQVDPFLIDDLRLPTPLYYSPTHGYRLFAQSFVERAAKSRSYVLDHPNRPFLDQAFEGMAKLANEFHFQVTVLLTPSGARLHAHHFENFPPVSAEPHLLNYVRELADGVGFNTLDLFQLMRPFAKNELLYFPDDSHWNERGNDVVAIQIAKHVFNQSVRSGQERQKTSE